MTIFHIEILFLLFLIYSFLGWLIESIGDFILHKKFINRGFLIGPYCPIYGTGVILITLLLGKYHSDYIALFFLSGLLCGILEYITSYIMEKVFKSRWWDYSKMQFNINGRICLETLVFFALAGPLILNITNPFFKNLLVKIPQFITHIISGILLALFITDVIFSLNIINSIKKIKDTVSVQVKDNTDEISSKVKAILMEKSASYKRIIVAFPQAFVDRIKNKKEKLEKINEKYLKNYTSKIKLSLMKIYNKNKE